MVNDPNHPVTKGLPPSFESPANEWYVWKPSPRLNKDVRILVTLDPSNYPLGLKDVLTGGDLPVVWTNTKYKMIYMNVGHGDKIFTDAGFEWRLSSCSMCVASNGDIVPPGKRAISTTNRNFEHRQGPKSRSHLASPAMVAAAAVTGCITDVRKLMDPRGEH